MRTFDIKRPDEGLREAIRAKIDNLNKPKGSLGRLETLAEQICLVQQTLNPTLTHPCHLLLGGDHGIEREGVSVSPREVTWQQMKNFTHGGGGVNMFCRQHGFDLRIVDMGVDYDLSGVNGIIDHKIARSTRNFRYEAAMSEEEFDRSIDIGAQLADECAVKGCNILCIGEMGIGNTSPSSIWMSLFGNIPLDECIGAGAGLDDEGIAHKKKVLREAVERFLEEQGAGGKEQEISHRTLSPKPSTLDIIRYFGGFEMTGAIGAMLRAAERGMLIMVDGFIMSACMLAASRLYPAVLDYAIFGHCGDESGHRRMLSLMNAEPLLELGMRLGEGTGALCAYPIIESAVRMVNEMNNFDNASITKYF
ncbi:MAG: nicotinate-nucleotide--dimethylbenzimidazole phosphoribosyltransferase [Prevotella sp.]|nr:nicotinate-nucleotide--dimethylbenzimidazole phosphoribosyltransferase [Prevotella sp.]